MKVIRALALFTFAVSGILVALIAPILIEFSDDLHWIPTNPMIFLFKFKMFYPVFKDGPILNTSLPPFEWTKILRDNYTIILKEFENFQNEQKLDKFQLDTLLANQKRLNRDRKWVAVMLRCYGIESKLSHKYFPETMKLIHAVDKSEYLHHVMLSILQPQKSIPIHRGYNHGVLRYHLGLFIPKHDPADHYLKIWPNSHHLNVKRESDFDPKGKEYKTMTWASGKDFIFDDTLMHLVVNKLNQTRLLLWVDFERRDLSFYKTIINKIMIFVLSKFGNTCPNALETQNKLMIAPVGVQPCTATPGPSGTSPDVVPINAPPSASPGTCPTPVSK